MTGSPKIYVSGHAGMVGSAIIRNLRQSGHKNIVTRTRDQLDLTDQLAVEAFFDTERPDLVYLAAAKVGGIHANTTYPAEFIYQNIMIQANVVNSAFSSGVKRLLFLGSSCIYPKLTPQPMHEESLLTGLLEPTNEPYAVAKIAGIKLCESYNRQYGSTHGISYRSIMPTNLYGPGDNYHAENSHVIPALIRRFHEAKISMSETVSVWGTGTPKREFLFVDDLATACRYVMELDQWLYEKNTKPMLSHLNVGSGNEISIYQLALTIAKVVGFLGEIIMDVNKPDGSPRKLMDSNRLRNLGWQPKVSLIDGLTIAYRDFVEKYRDG